MAFGNPYEEPWGPEIVEETTDLAERYWCEDGFAGGYRGHRIAGDVA